MSEAKRDVAARFQLRRGMGEAEAALYVGISSTMFSKMVEAKTMPRPRMIGKRRVWDIDDLDAAFRDLPREGGEEITDSWGDYVNAKPKTV